MGVVLKAIAVLLALVVGALLTDIVERAMLRHTQTEPGPATPVSFWQGTQPARPDRWLYPAGPVIALLSPRSSGPLAATPWQCSVGSDGGCHGLRRR